MFNQTPLVTDTSADTHRYAQWVEWHRITSSYVERYFRHDDSTMTAPMQKYLPPNVAMT